MTPWHQSCRLRCRLLLQASHHRPYSTAPRERVQVRCGSGGHVTIDLFNMRGASIRTDPLLVYLPPFPSRNNFTQLPSFLNGLPVASINYRWSPYSKPWSNTNASTPLHWPTPLHDTAFSMEWLLKHLCPHEGSRRDIYVYGSYLGASLATSLALTEARPNAKIGVDGLLAYNGIYDWTMFLPEHPINKPSTKNEEASLPSGPNKDSRLHELHKIMPALFHKAMNLFDPFASPVLFFRCQGLSVPETFMTAEDVAWFDDATSDDSDMTHAPIKSPRKSHLIFPPKGSGLKIPETLIVCETPPTPAVVEVADEPNTKATSERTKSTGHNFQSQAAELVDVMRRSIHVKERTARVQRNLDVEDIDAWGEIAMSTVQMIDAGPETGNREPSDKGCEIISSWLDDKF